jgi:shikimate kinase
MPSELSNIYLIGYRCTGKSTVGRKLAEHRGVGFYDTDELIAAGEQKSIARIIASQGWPYFRALEKKHLGQLSAKQDAVIATGGGIVLQPDNIACMQNSGKIIWLRARPRTIMDRLRQDPATVASRPALTRQALAEEVLTTLEERREHYRQAADLSLRTDGIQLDEIVAQIQEMLA